MKTNIFEKKSDAKNKKIFKIIYVLLISMFALYFLGTICGRALFYFKH
jgi:Trk-type K+ transport system membrane component